MEEIEETCQFIGWPVISFHFLLSTHPIVFVSRSHKASILQFSPSSAFACHRPPCHFFPLPLLMGYQAGVYSRLYIALTAKGCASYTCYQKRNRASHPMPA